MPEPLNHNYQIEVQVLTPLHIGGGKENNWQKDIDFFCEKDNESKIYKLRLVNQDKLFGLLNAQELESLSSMMASEKSDDFKDYLLRDKKRLEAVTIKEFELSMKPEQSEIAAMIRNGQGRVLMPGSSLKGAFRSILFKAFKQVNERNLQQVFGSIDQDWMRLLRVTDAHFDNSDIVHTKIFNLQGDATTPKAGWKHRGRDTNDKFKANGFITTLEVIPPGSKSHLRVSLADGVYQLLSKHQQTHAKTADFIKQGKLALFFEMINHHTREYLEKEIRFFEKFSGDKTTVIVEKLKELLDQVPKSNASCLLRLGLGSGFHSITGDWQHSDYTSTGVWTDGPNRRKGNFKVKSRKLTFTGGGDQTTLMPLGFIKLTMLTEDLLQRRAAAQRQLQEQAAAEEETRRKAEAERQRIWEEKIAKMPEPVEGELAQGAIIEAEVYKIERAFNMAKYCPEPGKYSNQTPLEVGKKVKKAIQDFDQKFVEGALVKVRVEVSKKGRVTLYFVEFVQR